VQTDEAGSGVTAQGHAMPLTGPQVKALGAATDGPLNYGIRPEDLILASGGLPGTLALIEPTGPETYVTVETAVGAMTVRMPGHWRTALGERVHLQWQAARSHLFGGVGQRRLG
jgi:multiple sugar transport system ATP-binding protein